MTPRIKAPRNICREEETYFNIPDTSPSPLSAAEARASMVCSEYLVYMQGKHILARTLTLHSQPSNGENLLAYANGTSFARQTYPNTV
jgi:hypothetical protein